MESTYAGDTKKIGIPVILMFSNLLCKQEAHNSLAPVLKTFGI